MLTSAEALKILRAHAPRNTWISLNDLYGIVSRYARLEDADRGKASADSQSPWWKRTVRNALQSQKGSDDLDWERPGRYRFR